MSQYDDIYTVVRQIPAGRVSSYGRIAQLTAVARGARAVGYALFALAGGTHDVPWWRVVNAAGRISNPYNADLQRDLLLAEGVVVDADGRVDLAQFLWQP